MPGLNINLILLLSSAQGFFLVLLIFHRHRRLFANRFLGAMIGLYSLMLFYLYLGELDLLERRPHLMLLLMGFGLLIPPLHYLYSKYMIRSRHPFPFSEWFHFLPFLIYEGIQICVMIRYPGHIQTRLERMASGVLSVDDRIYNWLILVQAGIYLTLTLRLLHAYSGQIKTVFSTIEKIRLAWLRNITLFVCGVMLIFAVENIFFLFGINLTHYFSLTSTLTAVYVYAIGYLGLLKSEVFTAPEVADSIQTMSEIAPRSPGEQKYEKSGLSDDRASEIHSRLLHLMEFEAPFSDCNLTLTQLASRLLVTPHNLSEVLNSRIGQNFFDFINEYRVEKVKQDLADPKKKHFTLLAIAFDAGFNSKTTFNTIFKKQAGLTPSEFRRQFLKS
jgi:AraC-like DNA-binding protein